jgi:hypothetical protein
MKLGIDDSQIDSERSFQQPQFIDNQTAWLFQQYRSDFMIVQG